MTESAWKTLRNTLIERYDDLAKRLARTLGSRDRAENALHDTWLRLGRENQAELGEIRNPRGYLLRMALNVAETARRSEPKWLTYGERVAFLNAMDDRPGPEDIALNRSQLCLVERAILDLPSRRRAIFEAAWLDQRAQKDIAAEHDLSVRMVQIELKQAMQHILDRVARSNVVDFASDARNASTPQKGER